MNINEIINWMTGEKPWKTVSEMRCDEGARELTVTAAPAEGLHKTGHINVQLAMEEGPMGPPCPGELRDY